MIEMRWVWGSDPAPEFCENMARSVKVLQYRYMEKSILGQTIYESWSDWIDVPTVTEG